MGDRLTLIEDTLGALDGISMWSIREIESTEVQLNYALADRDSARSVSQIRWTVDVYVDLVDGSGSPMTGSATVDLGPDDGPEEIRRRLEDTRDRAAFAPGPKWTLPGPDEPQREVECWDRVTSRDPWAALESMAEAAFSAADRLG